MGASRFVRPFVLLRFPIPRALATCSALRRSAYSQGRPPSFLPCSASSLSVLGLPSLRFAFASPLVSVSIPRASLPLLGYLSVRLGSPPRFVARGYLGGLIVSGCSDLFRSRPRGSPSLPSVRLGTPLPVFGAQVLRLLFQRTCEGGGALARSPRWAACLARAFPPFALLRYGNFFKLPNFFLFFFLVSFAPLGLLFSFQHFKDAATFFPLQEKKYFFFTFFVLPLQIFSFQG